MSKLSLAIAALTGALVTQIYHDKTSIPDCLGMNEKAEWIKRNCGNVREAFMPSGSPWGVFGICRGYLTMSFYGSGNLEFSREALPLFVDALSGINAEYPIEKTGTLVVEAQ